MMPVLRCVRPHKRLDNVGTEKSEDNSAVTQCFSAANMGHGIGRDRAQQAATCTTAISFYFMADRIRLYVLAWEAILKVGDLRQ